MTGRRMFLGAEALVWLPYGLFCVFRPDFLEEAAGIAIRSPTASTELRAMYGGLQAAIGAAAVLGLVRPAHERAVVLLLAFLCTGLATARLLGLALDGGFSSYTASALVFEIPSATIALALLRRPAAHR